MHYYGNDYGPNYLTLMNLKNWWFIFVTTASIKAHYLVCN